MCCEWIERAPPPGAAVTRNNCSPWVCSTATPEHPRTCSNSPWLGRESMEGNWNLPKAESKQVEKWEIHLEKPLSRGQHLCSVVEQRNTGRRHRSKWVISQNVIWEQSLQTASSTNSQAALFMDYLYLLYNRAPGDPLISTAKQEIKSLSRENLTI